MAREIIFDRPPVRVRMCKHGPLIYYTTDWYIGRSLDLYGEYCEGEIDLFRQLVGPGSVVVDAGANIGVFTVFLARAVGPNGRVHAFEPQRSVYHMLCGNLALNSLTNVNAVHGALGAAPASLMLPLVNHEKEGNFGGFAVADYANSECATERVAVTTIDALGLTECRMIKVDVEGTEREVLEGATETLVRCRPLLCVENDRPDKSAALISFLLERDYRLFWHLPRLFNPDNHFGHGENVFGGLTAINMFCVPRVFGTRIVHLHEIVSPEAKWEVADELYLRGDPELAAVEATLAQRPEDTSALNDRGRLLLDRHKRFDEALDAFDAAIALQPDLVEAHYNRGNTLAELKRFDEALESYANALKVRPDFVLAHNNRGWLLHRLGRLEEALESYERALAIKPDHPSARANRDAVLRAMRPRR